MKTVFCNTTDVRSEIKRLFTFQENKWNGFDGNENTFADLQNKVLAEAKYLEDFWDDQIVNDQKFWGWSCLQAFDDTPEKYRMYCSRSKEFRNDHVCKYDVLHDRERYLYELNTTIWSLFHDWQFVTQGWTAY